MTAEIAARRPGLVPLSFRLSARPPAAPYHGRMRRRTMLAVAAGATLAGCSSRAAPAPAPAIVHQPGVVTPPPEFATLIALDVAGAGLGASLGRIATLVAQVHASKAATVTVAAGASLFDDRFGLSEVRPQHLTAMPSFPNDVLDPAQCHGDLLLQICAERRDLVAAVAADLTRPEGLTARWRCDGFRAENRTTPGGLPTTRNLFGFREGAGNPDPRDDALMDRVVWARDGEPAWAAGGTYQVVRMIRFATELWDRDPVSHQEAILGRRRDDGTPLSGGTEDAHVSYDADPDGRSTPLDSHIRRADPRTPGSERHRILRRGYSYRKGLDQGLIFICFQRDVQAGFATVQNRLTGEALQRYVLPFGGGYYFVPSSIDVLRGLTTS
ncbi:Dyp-type peroxidase [Plantactinospora sp. B6F1]|uniref:Dyp-type peroxidase n=1 Tax=Plantactinospora sp. B6F1 TaxID=3158971 RepID=UPI001A937DE7